MSRFGVSRRAMTIGVVLVMLHWMVICPLVIISSGGGAIWGGQENGQYHLAIYSKHTDVSRQTYFWHLGYEVITLVSLPATVVVMLALPTRNK